MVAVCMLQAAGMAVWGCCRCSCPLRRLVYLPRLAVHMCRRWAERGERPALDPPLQRWRYTISRYQLAFAGGCKTSTQRQQMLGPI